MPDNRSPLPWLLVAVALTGCGPSASHLPSTGEPLPAEPVLLGEAPVPRVHLFENHSSALIAWRRAGVRDRILLHLDGHADFDWLPDRTVARIAAARSDELGDFELHPYALGPETHDRFGIWNFIYPASRIGIVRELVWVVPDGTLADRGAAQQLIGELLIRKMQGIRIEEAQTLRFENGVIRGQLLDLPVMICELERVPRFEEPVLLDIDLDYFSTGSAISQEVIDRPWIQPDELLRVLQGKQLRTDIATLSLSTIGGFLPPEQRWIGRYLQDLLTGAGRDAGAWLPELRSAIDAASNGASDDAIARLEAITREHDEPNVWFVLSRELARAGRDADAETALARAVAGDPVYDHHELFRADALWLNQRWSEALTLYRRYLGSHRNGPFSHYAQRRVGGCLARLNRVDEAIETYRELVAAVPRHGDTRMDLAMLLRERGVLDEAIAHLKEARAILPDRSLYALALGTTYVIAGRHADGAHELREALRRHPCLVQAHANLTVTLLQLGQPEEAARHLQTALYFQPRNPRLRAVEGELRRRGLQLNVTAPPQP